MSFKSINPATGETIHQLPAWDDQELEATLTQVAAASPAWAATSVEIRCRHLTAIADLLREHQDKLARIITLEMGKLISESRAEIEKCALGCEYYAQQAAGFLADEIIESDAGFSCVSRQPLGTVLAIMPWNFPFWQVFRFAAPALAAGNTAVLKHASNVPQCALAIEQLFIDAGFPDHVFRSLMIRADQVRQVIEDPRIHAATLTGSEPAGRQVAAHAGAALKKTVLELGGSDAFIVLEDADLDQMIPVAVASRFMNAGQSCIAAKRFIVVERLADDFAARFRTAIEALHCGDPFKAESTLAPMARTDLRDELHQQVQTSIKCGAVAVTGCQPHPGVGAWYQASLLDHVKEGMPAYDEELFGPVASIIRVADEQQALDVANSSRFGLGGSVWTGDSQRGERVARQVQAGAVFVNGLVKSDPRLPFGGIKASGYGRELSHYGMHEFVNHKTLWIR
jgi:succinate-semialdehyde dehydrogenase/glutarate-semialdehyde dehydrogenase